jgi:hypothetical protein
MIAALALSSALGLGWSVIAVRLMGGRWVDTLTLSWLIAGAVAGLVAGRFTVWSRSRRDGREHVLDVFATFYLAIVVYSTTYSVGERVLMLARLGRWMPFESDDGRMILAMVWMGTILYGIVLIPLTWASRSLVWKVYERAS